MEKRWTIGLLVAIGLALAGLVTIQVKWIRDTAVLKEELYEQAVQNALYAVSERLELEEKLRDLSGHEEVREFLLQEPTAEAGVVHQEGTSVAEEAVLMRILEPLDRSEQEALVEDMVRGLLSRGGSRAVRDRIDPLLLDSLMTMEFQAKGVSRSNEYGVFTAKGEVVHVSGKGLVDTIALANSSYRERLFRADLIGEPIYLHVLRPDREGSLIGGMIPLLVTSILFILVIIMAFILAIRIILRQKRLGDIRNDLVNNLTHELKTPISTIALACEALADPSIPKSEQQLRTYTAMIKDENKRLGQLVESVLQSAVLDSGKLVVKRVQLDLHALIADVVRSSSMQVSRRNGNIELDLKAEIHHVMGDRIHLSNLLYNLIDNAVKYTEQAPRVRIATKNDNEGVHISVSDNGIGIPASEQNKIFDRLYRVPTGDLHNTKGFGLGLSYVRSVLDRHGGKVRLDSSPGRGSTFHLFIPFEHDESAQAPRSGR